MQITWPQPNHFPTLSTNAAHIWAAPLQCSPAIIQQLRTTLNQDEQQRAARFYSAEHATHFICARGTLRLLLGKYLQLPPHTIEFTQNQYGKPFISTATQNYTPIPLQFNVSHSHGLALFAFALHHQIGIDVEYVRPNIEYLQIAKRFFAPAELQNLLALPQDQQLQEFYNCWSRKEAFIKAIGKGLYHELQQFSVAMQTPTTGTIVQNGKTVPNWRLFDLAPTKNFAAATATNPCITEIKNHLIKLRDLLL